MPGSARDPQRRPVAVAITGGIGAGKSEALAAFARHGAVTISSDDIVHRLLREDDVVRRELSEVADAGAREPRLIPDAEKVKRADFAYVNDGTRQELDDFVARVLEQLEARA